MMKLSYIGNAAYSAGTTYSVTCFTEPPTTKVAGFLLHR